MAWKYFKLREFYCKCGCGANVAPSLISKLDQARDLAGVPFHINSGRRCRSHNMDIGANITSSHIKGLAADIRAADSPTRYRIVKALLEAGFDRIGIHERFIHADIDNNKARGVMWFY